MQTIIARYSRKFGFQKNDTHVKGVKAIFEIIRNNINDTSVDDFVTKFKWKDFEKGIHADLVEYFEEELKVFIEKVSFKIVLRPVTAESLLQGKTDKTEAIGIKVSIVTGELECLQFFGNEKVLCHSAINRDLVYLNIKKGKLTRVDEG